MEIVHLSSSVNYVFDITSILLGLAGIGDFSAIDDTLGARGFAAGVLITTVLILNLIALLRGKNKSCETC